MRISDWSSAVCSSDLVGDTEPPRRFGHPATHGQGAELSQAMAVSTGPAVHSTAPTPRNSTCAPPRTEQAAGDGGNGVGVVPAAHRRVQRVLEVQARESMCRDRKSVV